MELRSKERSHIARPKRGNLPCQLISKMSAIFPCTDIKYSRYVYSNRIFHKHFTKLLVIIDASLCKYVYNFGWMKKFK